MTWRKNHLRDKFLAGALAAEPVRSTGALALPGNSFEPEPRG